MADIINSRIESEPEVRAFIQNLNYALDNGAKIVFQIQRLVDEKRDIKYTNQYTITTLFPNENPEEALKREVGLKMKIINTQKRICPCCMEEHEVKTVLVKEHSLFKDKTVEFEAQYMYCDKADEMFAEGDQLRINDINLKDSYRKAEGLLTSQDIISIRGKYGISQSDLCTLLGWGGKTIARYETHQVQDRAHDAILKKLASDPEWLLTLLEDAEKDLSAEAYSKYQSNALSLYRKMSSDYLRKAIRASVNYETNDIDIQTENDQIAALERFLRLNAYKRKIIEAMIDEEEKQNKNSLEA